MKPNVRPRSIIIERDLASQPVAVDSFCCEVRKILLQCDLAADVFPVEMLLRESLNNAVIHGNCWDCRKTIRAEVRVGRKWIVLSVEDEGTGFNPRKTMNTVPSPETTSGRGLALYFLYAQRVSFNSKGNRVSLWRAITGE